MQIDLTKQMAVHLLKGVEPYYNKMDIFLKQGYASFDDYHGWCWRYDLEELLRDKTIEEILEYYKVCLESWNK